ncbi:MAG TPA: hypothetical protein VFL83_15190 [Anaeromyxobacter sp.]|nr:hypothetical protein [Anaeromyxobacter sp.]
MRAHARQIRCSALAAAALALACAREADVEPRVRSVQPARGVQGTAVAIRIEGEGLEPHVLTDYGDEGASVVDARFQAWLGAARLREVRPSGDGALLAVVPEDLAAGTYDLAVADPAGKRAALPAAFRVLSPEDGGVLVASFRFDAIAPQVANAPFAVTVTALDAAGQVVTGFSGTASLADRTGAVVPSAIGPFAWGSWTGPVEVRGAHGADALTAADGLGNAGTSNGFAVLPAPAARVVFASPAVNAIAGGCAGPVTVALEDLYGAPTSASVPVAVSVSAGAVEVFSDASCAIAAAGATVPAGATSASVFVRSALAAPFTLDAAAPGLDPGAQPGLVRPAPPARLVFATAPQTVTAGACSAAATVRAEDAFGNLSPVPADTVVSLSSTATGGLSFHASAGCGAGPVGGVILGGGASAATFWFRATTAEAVTVGAAGAGVAGAATQGETILPAAPQALAFVTASQTVAAGSCSGAATVEARDAHGNAAPVTAATAIALAAAPPASFAFHLDPACADAPVAATALAPGATRASFRFRATVAGAYALTATGAGLPVPASQPSTVGPAAAERLVFTSAPTSTTAGQCSGPLTVEVRDGLGNAAPVAASTPVSLAASPAAGTLLYATPDCSGPAGGPAIIPSASATATFSFRSTVAGAFDATATVSGLLPATQAQAVAPAAPDRLVFTTAPRTAAAGACSGAATVEARDAYGNVAPVAALTAVSLAAAPAAGFAFFDAAGCGGAPVGSVSLPAAASSATVWFRGTAAGAVTVTATGAGIPVAAAQVETVEPAAPAAVVFTSAPQTLVAGGCSGAARIELRDAFGNPTADPGAAIGLALSALPAAGLELFEDALCAVAVPGASIEVAPGAGGKDFWFAGTLAGAVTLTSAPAGLLPASQVETVLPAAAARIAFASAPVSAVAGACSAPVTVVSLDAYDNVAPVAGPTTVALAAAPGAGFELHAGTGCGGAPVTATVIPASGTTATFRFRGTVAGVVTATASAFGTSADQGETVLPAAPDRLVFTSPPQTATAGACSGAATVEARDAYGNVAPVAALTAVSLAAAPAAAVELFYAAGCGGPPVASVSIGPGASAATFWFRGTAAGGVTVTAAGSGIPTPATQGETILPAAPARLVFTTAPQTVTAGSCSAAAAVEVRDAYDNVAPVAAPTSVALSAAPAPGFQLFDAAGCGGAPVSSVSLPAAASSATFWFRGTAAGTVTVTATGAGIATPATQDETVAPAAPDRLVFTTDPQTATAGSCSAPATVEARDAYGNVAPVAAPTAVSLSAAPAAGVQLFAGEGCGGAPVTSVDLAAATAATTFSFRATAAGTFTVTAAGAGIAAAATQDEAVSPAPPDRLVFTTLAQTLSAGDCSSVATVEARDAYGNVSPVAALTAVTLAAAPATGFAFHDAAGCGGAPVTAVSIPASGSAATFRFRGTAPGLVTVTAAGAGIASPATQVETVNPGPTDHFVFDPVVTPWIRTWSYAVRVQAVDAFGNPTPTFTDAATLSLAVPQPPNGAGATLSCSAGCGSGAVTTPFVAGAWTGSVAVDWTDPDPQKLGVSVRATGAGAWASVAGASAPLDVIGAVRSPPSARVTASPAVVFVNEPVTLDASGSIDYQTPAASLQVSWDFQGASTAAPAHPTPAAPWTGWTATPTASNVYTVAGTYTARVAVRDADGDVGYGSVTVIVLPTGAPTCVVTTSADVDDGATACSGGGLGADGRLSLAEALRVAPNATTITFATPMRISGTGAYTVAQDDLLVVAPSGTVLDGKTLAFTGNRTRVVGLELANQTTPLSVGNRRILTLEDCDLHDMPGIAVYGTLTLTRVRMARCAGQCVYVTDASNSDTLTVRHSTFLGGAGAVGIDIAQCKPGKVALVSQSNVFAGLSTAVRLGNLCTGSTDVRHTTFASNGTGVSYPAVASPGHVLRNAIFSGHATAAVACGLATFASRDRHLLHQNASSGCLGGDPGTLAGDPLYLFGPAGDYRVGLGSPAVDSALDLGLFLLPQYPATTPRFLGAGPDRGGRETW